MGIGGTLVGGAAVLEESSLCGAVARAGAAVVDASTAVKSSINSLSTSVVRAVQTGSEGEAVELVDRNLQRIEKAREQAIDVAIRSEDPARVSEQLSEDGIIDRGFPTVKSSRITQIE